MFRVTIERIDDETGRVVASSMRMGDEEDGLGSICGCAINGINPARTDQVAAEIIEALDFGDEHPHDFFIGRRAHIDSMASSASAIVEGWHSFDKKPGDLLRQPGLSEVTPSEKWVDFIL